MKKIVITASVAYTVWFILTFADLSPLWHWDWYLQNVVNKITFQSPGITALMFVTFFVAISIVGSTAESEKKTI